MFAVNYVCINRPWLQKCGERMHTTSATLLERVRDPANQEAWKRFVQLYTPLLYSWAAQAGLRGQDAADLVQDVFVILLRKLGEFRYERDGSFRGWLRTVLRNKWHDLQRLRVPIPHDAQAAPLADLPDRTAIDDDAEYRAYLVRRALALIQGDFEPATWQAWQAFAMAGRPALEVARELGITAHAVYLAKARVLRRLRQEIAGLLED
jgi:RNA polymerase sigma-70 factor (ECF subfamily)